MSSDEHEYFGQFSGEGVLDIPVSTLRGRISNRAYNAAMRSIQKTFQQGENITVGELVGWVQSDPTLYGRGVGVKTVEEIKRILGALNYLCK